MSLHSNACVLFLRSSLSQERRVKMTAVLFAEPFFNINQALFCRFFMNSVSYHACARYGHNMKNVCLFV